MVNTTAAMNGGRAGSGLLPLTSLNHISIVCRSVEASLRFYTDVLGFVPIRRPGSFDFDGAWLFNYGIGIHLLQSEDPADRLPEKREINPKDNHISFQCESMVAVERGLKEMGIPYVQRCVEEGGINVDQIFFHDPDGFMIEICNCDNLPVIPLGERAPVMGACKRAAAVKQQQTGAPPAPTVTAVAAQCVPSAQAIRVGEETAHISCA
ncbi:glyoxylase I 4-like [Phragmites australis]|uniref:glyoxylase I 4-like n=1 Tax=Phragmites australis TaxID=29695 RepID=UPI002D77304C|nr:glyoxylase I 4-like [Phragmites australis]